MTHEPRPRVLVADDYPLLVAAIRRLLDPSCDVVGDTGNGAELLDAVARLQPDVVVLDVHLPGMNGLAACRQIRESGVRPAVVLISAGADPDIREHGVAAGASTFIDKYRLTEDLVAAVRKAFAERSSAQSPHPDADASSGTGTSSASAGTSRPSE